MSASNQPPGPPAPRRRPGGPSSDAGGPASPPPPSRRRGAGGALPGGGASAGAGGDDQLATSTPAGRSAPPPSRRRGAAAGAAGAAGAVSAGAKIAGKGGLGGAAAAAQTVADPNASLLEKADKGLSAGAEIATTAAVSAVASPLAGKAAGALVGAATRSKHRGKIVAVYVLLTILPFILGFFALMWLVTTVGAAIMADEVQSESDKGAAGQCEVLPPLDGTAGGVALAALTDEQRANATTLVNTTVVARGLETRDAVIVIMTALTESSLVNVAHGDKVGPDSRGLFQQRDSWGTLEQRMDPATATGLFLNALTDPKLKLYKTQTLINVDPGARHTQSPWLVAQSVQRSAYDDGSNYKAQYNKALAIVAEISGVSQSDILAGTGWNVGGAAGQIPGITDTVNCGTGPEPGGDYGDASGPGSWGGHANGRIPDEALCVVPYDPVQRVRCDAAKSLAEMNAAYFAVFGSNIGITDSYRDYDSQVKLKAQKPNLAAQPGTSNHGWGLALDLKAPMTSFTSAGRQWMVANAPKYGWYSPRWAQPGKGRVEPWHWEFGDSGF